MNPLAPLACYRAVWMAFGCFMRPEIAFSRHVEMAATQPEPTYRMNEVDGVMFYGKTSTEFHSRLH